MGEYLRQKVGAVWGVSWSFKSIFWKNIWEKDAETRTKEDEMQQEVRKMSEWGAEDWRNVVRDEEDFRKWYNSK